MKFFQKTIPAALFLLPLVVSAQSTFKDLAEIFIQIVKGLVALVFASLAVAMAYGVVVFLLNADNEKKRMEIKGYLLWGIIGITVVFGLWGILQILTDTMGWGTAGIPIIQPPA